MQDERKKAIYLARICEQTKRYEDMLKYIKKVVI